MGTILNILLFIFILGILVFVHEFGHFMTAKRSGVYIYEFSIGMGPEIKSIKGKDGVKYSIRALPLGGYVQMAGEIYEDDDTKIIPKEKFMCNRPWYQRLVILVAGVFNNFLLAIIILITIGAIWGSPTLTPEVGEVKEGYPAAKAGMQNGDIIKSINGKKTTTWAKAQLLLLVKDKDGIYEIETLKIKPKVIKDEQGNKSQVFGITTTGEIRHGFLNAIKYGFEKFCSTIDQMWLTIVSLFNGSISVKSLSGPVGIYTVVGASRKSGIQSVLFLIAYLSMNLGLMNILPIPALDGGHVLFLLIEKISGRKINAEVESKITVFFFFLLIALMIYISIFDVIRIFS